MSRLSKRLGEFKPGYYSERTFRKPAPEPVSHVCREEWQEYQKERQRLVEENRYARKKREEERNELERRQRERREAATARLASHGLSLLNIARHFLKEQELEEKAALRDRQAQLEQTQQLPRFKHWLGKRSPRQANLWRFRRRVAPDMRVRPFEFPRTGALSTPFPAYREMVKRRFADVKLARSRLDYMTACICAVPDTRRPKYPKSFRDTPPPRPPSARKTSGFSTNTGLSARLSAWPETSTSPHSSRLWSRFRTSTKRPRKWNGSGYITKHAKGRHAQPSGYDEFPEARKLFFRLCHRRVLIPSSRLAALIS